MSQVDQESERRTTNNALRTPRRWWSWLVGLGLTLGLILAGVGGWAWLALRQPIDPDVTEPVLVRVESGRSVAEIAEQLADRKLVRWPLLFRLAALVDGRPLQAGLYSASPSDRPVDLLERIAAGQIAERQVTLLEGWRSNEVAAALEAAKVADAIAFLEVARHQPGTVDVPTAYNLLADTFLEGFLFPDTYRIAADATPTEVVGLLVRTYLAKTEGLELTYETLTLASIVEREAASDEERPIIAGVYRNRLERGLSLDADPTVQYAKANQLYGCGDRVESGCATPNPPQLKDVGGEGWWPTITVSDYQAVDSPYNTYRQAGLPPRPIANPGLASLRAAAQPAEHAFLYFLHGSDGQLHLAKTLAEHTSNKRQFLK